MGSVRSVGVVGLLRREFNEVRDFCNRFPKELERDFRNVGLMGPAACTMPSISPSLVATGLVIIAGASFSAENMAERGKATL